MEIQGHCVTSVHLVHWHHASFDTAKNLDRHSHSPRTRKKMTWKTWFDNNPALPVTSKDM